MPRRVPRVGSPHIFVDNHSIYDVDQVDDGGLLGWVYGAANALHVKTRASFIRRELLFHVGDCYDPFLLEESGRLLRGYRLPRPGRCLRGRPAGRRQARGGRHPGRVDHAGRPRRVLRRRAPPGGARGLRGEPGRPGASTPRCFFRQRKERQDLGGTLRAPPPLRTRRDGRPGERRTHPRSGTLPGRAARLSLRGRGGTGGPPAGVQPPRRALPLRGERPRGAATATCCSPTSTSAWSSPWRAGWGGPGNLTLLGLGLSRETLDFEGFPGERRDRPRERLRQHGARPAGAPCPGPAPGAPLAPRRG